MLELPLNQNMGKDRWLQRMFAVADSNKSSASRSIKSHVCLLESNLNCKNNGQSDQTIY